MVKAKDLMVIAGAALAVLALLKYSGVGAQPQYWATAQGNTGYPDAARTGGGVWV